MLHTPVQRSTLPVQLRRAVALKKERKNRFEKNRFDFGTFSFIIAKDSI